MVVCGAIVSTVNDRVAGVASGDPWGSTARTANVCRPSASALSVSGDAQEPRAPPSTPHSKWDPGSLELKPNVGVESEVVEPAAGPETIEVAGGVGGTTVTLTSPVCTSPLKTSVPSTSIRYSRPTSAWNGIVTGFAHSKMPLPPR